jgi:hypothetical protein
MNSHISHYHFRTHSYNLRSTRSVLNTSGNTNLHNANNVVFQKLNNGPTYKNGLRVRVDGKNLTKDAVHTMNIVRDLPHNHKIDHIIMNAPSGSLTFPYPKRNLPPQNAHYLVQQMAALVMLIPSKRK